MKKIVVPTEFEGSHFPGYQLVDGTLVVECHFKKCEQSGVEPVLFMNKELLATCPAGCSYKAAMKLANVLSTNRKGFGMSAVLLGRDKCLHNKKPVKTVKTAYHKVHLLPKQAEKCAAVCGHSCRC